MSRKKKTWGSLIAEDLQTELRSKGHNLSRQQVYGLRKILGWQKIHKPKGADPQSKRQLKVKLTEAKKKLKALEFELSRIGLDPTEIYQELDLG